MSKLRMKRYLKVKKFLYIKLIIILISAVAIYKFDSIRMFMSPKNYWGAQVQTLESNMKNYNWKIKELELMLDREKLLGKLDEEAAFAKAQVFEVNNFEEGVQEEAARREEKIADLQKQLEKQISIRVLKEQELATAKQQYLGSSEVAPCGK